MEEYRESDYLNALDAFEFSSFKSDEQKYAIECIVNEKFKDMIISMASQAGKSLCYQLPRQMQRSGVVLVISPNISLITNQVAYLTELRIPATSITSVTPQCVRFDLIKEFKDYEDNPYQFLFVTPEMMFNGNIKIQEMINNLMHFRKVCLVVVDEAHTLIDTGFEFRNSYLLLADRRRTYRDIPWVALTTASRDMLKLIGDLLAMHNPEIIKGPSTRPNIFYDVKIRNQEGMKDLIVDLIQLNEKSKKHVTKKIYASGIIYCHTAQEADEIAAELNKDAISCESFYGSKKDCNLIQKNWKDGVFPILVATEDSFGMGIRRTPLQFVVHMSLPKNMRSFYQQSGRVDIEHGFSRIIFDPQKFNNKEMLQYVNYCGCRHEYIAKYFGDDEIKACGNRCDNCIALKPNPELEFIKTEPRGFEE